MHNKFLRIKEECLRARTADPIALICGIMEGDCIGIHGPEHHVLDGACFLTALHNAGMAFDLESALDEMIRRGSAMPGATCGHWGMCGSAASVGAALSILQGTGPLSDNDHYKNNLRLVSNALSRIADVGGPRCCKRNAFLSLQAAMDLAEQTCGVSLTKSEIRCSFFPKNQQCIGTRCPFHPGVNPE